MTSTGEMRHTIRIARTVSSMLFLFFVILQSVAAQNDTIWAPQTTPVPQIKWKHQYHQTLTMKLFLSQAEFDGKNKRKDNGKSTVYLNIADALEVIKKIDNLTLGIPKIIYLVGWQYNGHDSKYPAFFEGNEKLKRPQDKNALQSIRWLMKEAKQYHTTVSLHINMFDAYEDSPLWDEYMQHDIIAKTKDGQVVKGEWGSPISYAQEWKTGYTKKRIDSLCKLLPIQQAGTIHIDAFHTWPPLPAVDSNGKAYLNFEKKVISPYLNFTVADETAAQKKIFRYWAAKGIDVSSEGVDFLRETDFGGLQPMGWWFIRSAEDYLKYPAAYYTGGVDNEEWGKIFGTSMHGEDVIKDDPKELAKFPEQFMMTTAVWYYLNRLQRLYVVKGKDFTKAVFANGVESMIKNGKYTLTKQGKLLVDDDNVNIPAFWMPVPALLLFSKNTVENHEYQLPESFKKYKQVDVFFVTPEGKKLIFPAYSVNNSVSLTFKASTPILIVPHR
jgi:hypothetical protein